MNKKNILSFVLVGALFSLTLGMVTKADAKDNMNNITQCGTINVDKLKEYDTVEILGKKYNFSNINPAVVQVAIRTYDDINTNNIIGSLKTKKLKDLTVFLDQYLLDPSKFQNFPITLDLGPSSLLREEIQIVRTKMDDLKKEQETIKLSKMHPKAIEEKVNELQEEINKLAKWINYSVVNFKSESYRETFCEDTILVDGNNKENKQVLFSFVSSNSDHDKIFRALIKENGEFEIQGEDLSDMEIAEIIQRSTEFENLKVRNLLKEKDAINLSKLAQIEKDKRIKAINKEIQSVKAYGTAKEIILLNLSKSAVEKTRISPNLMEERINMINDQLKGKIENLNKYNDNKDYEIQGSEIGKRASYFGYAFEDKDGFAVKVEFDEKNNVIFKGMENMTQDQKVTLKRLVNEEIKEAEEKISELELDKNVIENKENNNNYYLLDGINKEISILNNDIENFKNILSKI